MLAPAKARNKVTNGARAFRRWIVPYINSRIRRNELRPLLSYLFTEWDCNMQCHYCYTYGSGVPGMSYETACSSIDWLQSVGCRVVAIMGGEPLLRPDFIADVIRYGTERGSFMYLATNGVPMTPEVTDAVGRAGVAALNVAVDGIEPKPGMPKALNSIRPQFDYMVEKQRDYGYVLFLNINITSKNLQDVRRLTKLARELEIGTDYHLNERPHIDQPHYAHGDNDTYIRPDQFDEADELLDWLIAENKGGHPMVNSVFNLQAMKQFMRGQTVDWSCRAGRHTTCVRIDGSLSPCFGLYSSTEDWGRIWAPRYDAEMLQRQKQQCQAHCLSTCQLTMHHYYDVLYGAPRWVWKHAMTGV